MCFYFFSPELHARYSEYVTLRIVLTLPHYLFKKPRQHFWYSFLATNSTMSISLLCSHYNHKIQTTMFRIWGFGENTLQACDLIPVLSTYRLLVAVCSLSSVLLFKFILLFIFTCFVLRISTLHFHQMDFFSINKLSVLAYNFSAIPARWLYFSIKQHHNWLNLFCCIKMPVHFFDWILIRKSNSQIPFLLHSITYLQLIHSIFVSLNNEYTF